MSNFKTPMGLGRRKAIELGQKLDSLEGEFADWRARSEAGQSLQKHHTQIRRITGQLDGFREEIGGRLRAVADDAGRTLAGCRDLELDILVVHRIWDFFRAKLVQRGVPRFEAYLTAADEFAWDCYDAARRKVAPTHLAVEEIKEPPLVFFDGRSSPFASSRNRPFEAEAVAGEDLPSGGFIDILKALPIPVISLPWFQVQHLPDALVLGHEVGHTVEEDLRLTERLRTLLDAALDDARVPPGRRKAWRRWLGEVFADIYGTLAGGPAFVGALLDFLAADPASITGERQSDPYWREYPTSALRAMLILEVLDQQGFAVDAERLRAEWADAYATHAMAEFEPDIPRVIGALIDGPYPELGNITLSAVLSFSRDDHERARVDASRLLQRYDPLSDDSRILFAASRLAYEMDPVAFGAVDLRAKVLGRVPPRLRSRADTLRRKPEELAALDAYDRQAGSRLSRALKVLRSEP